MFGTVRKHQTWLWAIIIVVIIVAFVFMPNANMDMGGGGPAENFGTIQGKPISRDEMREAYNDVRILYRLRFQQWPVSDDFVRLEPEIYNRMLLSRKLEQMSIHVSPEATVAWIKNLFQRGGIQGASVADQYQQFVKTQLEPNGITAADFERFAQSQVGEEHLRSVFGISGGLVPSSEAETLYKRENETMQADVVFFSASNYLDKVTVDDEALTRYFNLNKPNYRIPNRIQVDYVRFDPTNFMSAAEQQFAGDTNLNLMLERTYFERGGTNYFQDPEGNPLTVEQAKGIPA
jgi:peptidyl-prolyl cis-trans isomerase D